MTTEPRDPAVAYLDAPGFPGVQVGADLSVWAARPGGWRRVAPVFKPGRNGPYVNLQRGGRCWNRSVAALLRSAREMADPRALRGEAHPGAKLDAKGVAMLRSLRAEGATYDALAAMFHVSRSNVYQIISRRTWIDD